MQGSGFRVQGAGCRGRGSGFRVQGEGCRVQGSCDLRVTRGAGRRRATPYQSEGHPPTDLRRCGSPKLLPGPLHLSQTRIQALHGWPLGRPPELDPRPESVQGFGLRV